MAEARTATLTRMVLPDHECPFGVRAKAMLEQAGFTIEEHILDNRAAVEAFKAEHGVATTPLIEIDGDIIGGSNDLEAYLAGAAAGLRMRYPVTPDGRYFMVRGRLWRMSDPELSERPPRMLVSDLMRARHAMGEARKAHDRAAGAKAKTAVDLAKRALGERGDAWWSDGAPDLNRHLARTTAYADWAAQQREPD